MGRVVFILINMASVTVLHAFTECICKEGDIGVYGDAVLDNFSCGISVISILTCGIAALSRSSVCGF